jgi:hypothetical protein
MYNRDETYQKDQKEAHALFAVVLFGSNPLNLAITVPSLPLFFAGAK